MCVFFVVAGFIVYFIFQLGMYTLSIMTEISKSTYLEHAESFAVLFTNTLSNLTELNSNLAYYTVQTMNNFAPVISGHQEVRSSFFVCVLFLIKLYFCL